MAKETIFETVNENAALALHMFLYHQMAKKW